jgi:PAS domain S-box-containing protein
MRPINFKGQLVLAFGTAAILFACVGGLSYRRILLEDTDQGWVEHTHLVLEKLDAVQLDLATQERGENTVNLGRPRLLEDLDSLRRLTADNSKQQEALDQVEALVRVRSAQFQQSSRGNLSTPNSSVEEALDQITGILQGMKQVEQVLLAHRLASASIASWRMKAILGAGGTLAIALIFVAGVVVQSEIRKRSHTEIELRSAEERYHLLFDSNPIPAWVYDTQSLAILDINAEAVSHYGYSRDEFLNLKITDIRPPEDVPAVLESAAKTPDAAQSSGPWKHRMKSGEIIDVEIKSYPVVFGGKAARLVAALDVTERNRSEEALRQSEERFRLLVSGVKDYAILMLDPEGRIASWSDGAERMKGYRAEEILGQDFSCFYTPEDLSNDKPVRELQIATKQGWFEDEGWRVRKDGSRFWANVVITALRDESGGLRGFGKVTRDMTERKAVEEEMRLRNAQLDAANKELEAFSYSVSHDLRAPLRSIDGFSQALLEDCVSKLDDTEKSHLHRIRAGTQRMGLLIDDLLNLSRVARAEMHRETINISDLARSVFAELQKTQPDRQVEVCIEDGVEVTGDPRLLRLVYENLLGNAWKFTSRQSPARIEVGRINHNGTRAYFIRDNGAGFDMAYAGKLFGAFQRLHGMAEFPGTGVGLATVQRIIHRHGGRIWAEGAIEQGASFYFTL